MRKTGLVPVIVLVLLFAWMVLSGFSEVDVLNSPILFLTLNTLFLTGTGLIVAIISAKSYLTEGSTSLLLLGMATTSGGIAALVAGWAASRSVNDNVAIFDMGFMFAGGLQLLSAIMVWVSAVPSPTSNRKRLLIVCYLAAISFVAVISALVIAGFAPEFFANSGPTLIRQWVLGIGTLLFLTSAIIFGWQYLQSKSRVLYWYSLALVLLAIALFGSALYTTPNGLVNWGARLSQYLGGICFLAAVLVSRREQKMGNASFSEKWAESFKSDPKQLDILFGKMLDGIAFHRIVCDGSGKPIDYVFLDVNHAFEQMTGLSKEKIIGRRVTKVIPGTEDDPADWIRLYGHVALTGESMRLENYSERLKKWFYVSTYSPKKGYFIAIYDDITERKELNKKLEEYARNLEGLVEERTKALKDAERLAAIGATAGMVGHDIRNPLQAITSDLFLLGEELKNMSESEGRRSMEENIESIEENIIYINKIVSDLQDYTRPLKPNIEEVNLKDLINNTLITANIPENIQAEVNIKANLLLKVDAAYIRRVLTNLVVNAIQAMPNGGKLTINASTEKDEALISVKDTGVGIPEDVKDKLFKPLFTTKAKGQGLGLAVVKRLIEGLNGKVSFESEKDKGTKFTISLPFKDDKP